MQLQASGRTRGWIRGAVTFGELGFLRRLLHRFDPISMSFSSQSFIKIGLNRMFWFFDVRSVSMGSFKYSMVCFEHGERSSGIFSLRIAGVQLWPLGSCCRSTPRGRWTSKKGTSERDHWYKLISLGGILIISNLGTIIRIITIMFFFHR